MNLPLNTFADVHDSTAQARDFLERFRNFEEAVRGYADEAFLEIIG